MKNGIYIEKFDIFDNCKVHYKDNKIIFIDRPNGTKYWINDGLLHRLDGPAVIWNDGYSHWYLDGKFIDVRNQKEFERHLLLAAFK